MQTPQATHPVEAQSAPATLPAYTPPAVVTYTDAQLLEALGPAQALRSYVG